MMPQRSSMEMFCCYARDDVDLFYKLEQHLAPLKREGLATLWADVYLAPGDAWEEAIHRHLETARIVLLLISPAFLNSDACFREMEQALERERRGETKVVPILLRPVNWQQTPFSRLQLLPGEAKPVESSAWPKRDEALEQVAMGIRRVIKDIQAERKAALLAEREAAFQAQTLPTSPPPLPPSGSSRSMNHSGQRRPLHFSVRLFLALLAVLFIASLSFVLFRSLLGSTQRKPPDPTAQTSGIVQAAGTISASIDATATASANATATIGPIATATSSHPVYQDQLNNANSPTTRDANWKQTSQCFFASDGYHITQPNSSPHFNACWEQNNGYGNLALSVDISIWSGHSGGVLFRLSANSLGRADGYLFEMNSQGQYKVSWKVGSTITPLDDWSATPLLHTGYRMTNLLQLIACNNIFLFYVNGRYLTQVQDSNNRYSSNIPTHIGFFATSAPDSMTKVVYSNLEIYTIT